MDDLKLIGRSEKEMRNEIRIVKTFSDDKNEVWIKKKCAKISLKN
jgi:hypothetical protein